MNSIKHLIISIFLIGYFPANAIMQDSIGLSEQNGKKYIVHQVGKETLYAISRKYNVSVGDIQNANPGSSSGLKLGQKLLIPMVEKIVLLNSESYVLHKVEANQTLYAVSKKYNVTVENIKKWNNLSSNDMKVGSFLIVGERAEPTITNDAASKQAISTNEPATRQATNTAKQELASPVNSTTKDDKATPDGDRIVEKGDVSLFETTDGNVFYYALHKSLPIGTIVYVTNNSNGNMIFARVIGKTPAEASNKTILKLSKVAFDKLQATNSFGATIEYMP